MKIMISYFNNIRHFSPYMIPISTAKWDPKWYHEKDNPTYVDKRGVIIGLRADRLVFSQGYWEKLVEEGNECKHECKFINSVKGDDYSTWCPFMEYYYEQLRFTLDFRDVIHWLEIIQYKYAELKGDLANLKKYIPVLIVHEKPDKMCSERHVLRRWFKDNKYELEEVPYGNKEN